MNTTKPKPTRETLEALARAVGYEAEVDDRDVDLEEVIVEAERKAAA